MMNPNSVCYVQVWLGILNLHLFVSIIYIYIHQYICINSIYLSHIHLYSDSVFFVVISLYIFIDALWICRSTVCLAVHIAPCVQVSFTGANAGRGLPLPEAQGSAVGVNPSESTVQLRVKAGLVFRFLQHWVAKSSNLWCRIQKIPPKSMKERMWIIPQACDMIVMFGH